MTADGVIGNGYDPVQPVRLHPTLSETSPEARFFLQCGIGKPHVRAATEAARANATTIEKELMAEGLIDPDLYYRWLACELGLPHLDEIDPEEVVRLPSMDVLLHRDGPLRLLRAAADKSRQSCPKHGRWTTTGAACATCQGCATALPSPHLPPSAKLSGRPMQPNG
ncbi:hypothetical protein OEG86_06720 [Hoeflea alexandrii]|uniref:hypothetical protein n=1 Tax=Hoeflea alexandrii TaxID=288436 RepID=UPI00226F3C42|nr:hypothetical protein [Hoeflea alexandrii]MCY0151993.1 hypothetical protein [Hoeflea alexandrii]